MQIMPLAITAYPVFLKTWALICRVTSGKAINFIFSEAKNKNAIFFANAKKGSSHESQNFIYLY